MSGWVLTAVALLAGMTASMGLGGGFVLLIYLTAFVGLSQMDAQWLNLLFFLPIGGLSLWLHRKNGLLISKTILPAVIAGIFGAMVGVLAAERLGNDGLRKGFALFLMVIGMRELFFQPPSVPSSIREEAFMEQHK